MTEIATPDAGSQSAVTTPSPTVTPSVTPGTASATPASGTSAAPPATPTGYTYQEDRSKWIPPYRFNEVSQRAQRVQQLEADLQERDRKIQALAGVAPPNPDDDPAKRAEIRSKILDVLGITEQQLQATLDAPQHLQRTQAAEQRQWQQFGNKQVDYLSGKVAETYGTDTLDVDQKADLRATFKEWLVQKAQGEIDTSGQAPTLDRYEAGDEKLLDEFVTRYTKNWVEPARRRAIAQTTQRIRPVISSTGRSQVTSVQRPEAFASLDDRLAYAADLLQERTGLFNR